MKNGSAGARHNIHLNLPVIKEHKTAFTILIIPIPLKTIIVL